MKSCLKQFSNGIFGKCEFLKFAIRKFTITSSKTKAKNNHEKKLHL